MSEPPAQQPESRESQVASRVSFDRLRERTDELELLISGLTLFALLSFPGWLLARFEDAYNRIPFELLVAAMMAVPMIMAVCYTVAIGFLAHLVVRAYWVALIGLKSVHPEGTQWARASTLGPITRERLQARVVPIERSIERADRLGSILFCLNLLCGLTLFWIGLLATVVFIVAGVWGAQFGEANHFVQLGIESFFNLMLFSVLALWLFDAQLAGRSARLRGSRVYRAWVSLLGRVVRIFFPERLVATLRLTLQSNSRPRSFAVLFMLLVLAAPLLGSQYFQRSADFDPFRTQRLFGHAEVNEGARSAHYETQRIGMNRRRGEPMIPAPVIETGWLPLFLPYQTVRDDSVVEARCPERSTLAGSEAKSVRGEKARSAASCFARLWEVRLNGKMISLDAFHPAERADLGFRGLSGYIDLRDEQPGPQRLDIVWRPNPETDSVKNDILGSEASHHSIPFLWSPEAAVEFSSPREAEPSASD